jgi:hypothetical protein
MRISRAAFLLLVSVFLAACASTTIRSAWFDANYKGGPLKRIAVIGVGGPVADRRVFEDIFAGQLRAAGVDGVAGYTLMLEETRQSEAEFAAAIDRSGVDGVLVVRLLGVDTRTQVSTAMVSGPMVWSTGFYGQTWIPATQVSQYQVARVESSLYETKTRRLIWSATTDTFNPSSVVRETPRFAELIITELRARELIAGTR